MYLKYILPLFIEMKSKFFEKKFPCQFILVYISSMKTLFVE